MEGRTRTESRLSEMKIYVCAYSVGKLLSRKLRASGVVEGYRPQLEKRKKEKSIVKRGNM